jgi:hypothetical protein
MSLRWCLNSDVWAPKPLIRIINSVISSTVTIMRSFYSVAPWSSQFAQLYPRYSDATAVSRSPIWNKTRNTYSDQLAAPWLWRLVTGFPPRRPRFEPRPCGICGGQSGTEAYFLRVLRFPLPIIIPSTAPHSSSITRGWYNRLISDRRTK